MKMLLTKTGTIEQVREFTGYLTNEFAYVILIVGKGV